MTGHFDSGAIAALRERVRGRLEAAAELAPMTWFRVGGRAEMLFTPADEDDLAAALEFLPLSVPVTVIGLASNLLVREGGIAGLVVRLGRGFNRIEVESGMRIRVGAAVPDARLAMAAAEAGIAGLAFYRGIPGAIGGALRMNAGCYGTETADRLVEARAVDRRGRRHLLKVADFGYGYRHSAVPTDMIFTEALFQGEPGATEELRAQLAEITRSREASQPVRSRTGGSTFKNPEGAKAWQLIDRAGCRGLRVGGAEVSQKHCNFLINTGDATAYDLELLGETVRRRVRETSGIALEWEIRRIGAFAAGRRVEEFSGG